MARDRAGSEPAEEAAADAAESAHVAAPPVGRIAHVAIVFSVVVLEAAWIAGLVYLVWTLAPLV